MTPDLKKYLEQISRKKEYNRKYYQEKIKPKRQFEKQSIENLKVYYDELYNLHEELKKEYATTLKNLEALKAENESLKKKITNLTSLFQ